MNILEALQAEVEYKKPALLLKIITDLGLNATAEYTAADKGSLEVATAHVLRRAAMFPDFAEGSLRIKYDAATLNAEADRLFSKNGITDQYSGPTVNGSAQW